MVLGSMLSTLAKPKRGNTPRYNVPFASTISQNVFGAGNLYQKKYLISLYKKVAELNAITNAFCSDIASDFHFEPIDKTSSKTKIQRAEEFAINNQLKTVMLNQCIDWQITGEGYSWMASFKKAQVKEVLKGLMAQKYHVETKEADAFAEVILSMKQRYLDEDLLKPRILRYIASSTMDVKFTEKDIEGYIQRVDVQDEFYTPEEIIRITDLMIDGKPYGYTPVHSLILQLDLLVRMWENQQALQKNGGAMSKVFAFEDLKIGSPAYKRVEEQLNSYRVTQNKHGNFMFTGKMDVKELQQMDGMQYKEVGLYILSIIAMHWQIPRSKLPVILGGTNAKSDIGGEAEKGYWSNIEKKQDRLAEIYNTQLFIPKFGVKLVFNKEYKQDDLQEQNVLALKLSNVEMANRLLIRHKKKLDLQATLLRLGIKEDELEDVSEDDMVIQTGMANQFQLPNGQVTKNSAGQANAENKKQEQQKIMESNRGKPSGV